MLTDHQMEKLNTSTVSVDVLKENGLNNDYYIKPLVFIQEKLGFTPKCSAQQYRHAVEMANDEDICPENSDMNVIVDGILAFLFSDQLEECGINLLTYFTYRFYPPSPEFQEKLDKFESLIRANGVET